MAGAKIEEFGQIEDGSTVHRITLGSKYLRVSVLTLGAVLHNVRLAGIGHGLTLGSPDVRAYRSKMRSFGALMGPVVNRIRNASAPILGTPHRFEANLEGVHTKHGGSDGTQHRVWTIEEASDAHVVLRILLEDGLAGFPGTRDIRLEYRVTASDLDMVIRAETDAPTLLNLANHSYWNLDGPGPVAGHKLEVHADRYTENGPDLMVTGRVLDVAGTDFDFRVKRRFAPCGSLRFDLNYCLADGKRALSPALRLEGQSGVAMEMWTTEPGLQVFDQGTIDTAPFNGHHGTPHAPFSSIALEAQGWPDAANHTGFPSIEVHPDAPYRQHTRWRFS
ncbi:aldose epimerase family protein [Tropicimonas sp. S265A]|uniref:aldose epimerase family protein n=1 Tax=Tropicimonas sp. S265A TaxID=3415134 RepID=UPI003C79F694